MTFFQAWSGKKPSMNNLRVFGCAAYSHIPKDERKKLNPKARRCIFLGYGDVTKEYRLYDLFKARVTHSRDVVFDETSLGFEKEQMKDLEGVNQPTVEIDVSTEEPYSEAEEEQTVNEDETNPDQSDEETSTVVRRSERTRQYPDYYEAWIYTAKEQGKKPVTVKEAMSSPEKEKWKDAMDKKIRSIKAIEVWELVKLQKGKKTVGCKWVYKQKVGIDGSVERYKAHLVAKGYSQQYGLDYDETFSPVARFESLRTLLALAVQDGLHVHQMDVTTAFLDGKLKEEVYMDQPEGFVIQGKESLVCKLKHRLYGLKQAPRCWNFILDKRLKEMGFVQTTLYIHRKKWKTIHNWDLC